MCVYYIIFSSKLRIELSLNLLNFLILALFSGLSMALDVCPNDLRIQLVTNSDHCRKQRQHTGVQEGSYRFILSDDENNSLYCFIAKCASTTWKALIAKQTRKYHNQSTTYVHNAQYMKQQFGLHYLSDYPQKEREFRLKNYFKYMIVRNPFERLYSSYKYMHVKKDYSPKHMNQWINKTLRNSTSPPGSTPKWLEPPVTFKEFLAYLAREYSYGKPGSEDQHWATYNNICDPCHIDYDYIAKVRKYIHIHAL